MIMATNVQESTSQPAPAMPPRQAVPVKTWAIVVAMLRKELREAVLVAMLAMLGWGAILAYVLHSKSQEAQYEYGGGSPVDALALPQSIMYGLTIPIGAVAALALGFMQFFFETSPGPRGFMLHRPASRGGVFLCKAAAGLALYLPAMIVPLLLALWWASRPANIPQPFSWKMGLAPLADIFAGVPYYFAGVLVAVRTDARWLGSRLVPIAGPVIASVLGVLMPRFGWSVLYSVGLTAVVALAAGGYFAAAGEYVRMRLPARATTGLLLACGLFVVGLASAGILDSLLVLDRSIVSGVSRVPTILTDGTVVVMETDDATRTTVVRDLAGKEVEKSRYRGEGETYKIIEFRTGDAGERMERVGVRFTPLRDPGYFFSPSGRIYGADMWYRAGEDEGNDYLVAFDIKARRLVGAIGAAGFEPGAATPRVRFPQPLRLAAALRAAPEAGLAAITAGGAVYDGRTTSMQDTLSYSTLFSAGNTVYGLTESGKLRVLWTAPETIQYFFATFWQREPKALSNWVVVTDKAVTLMAPLTAEKAEPVLRYTRPDLGDYQVSMGRDDNGRWIVELVKWSTVRRGDPNQDKIAVFLDAQGVAVREVKLPPYENRYKLSPSPAFERYVLPAIIPPGLGVALLVATSQERNNRNVDEAVEYDNMRATVICGATGVLAAVCTLLLARRRQVGKGAAWFWTGVALVLGPLGLVVMVSLRQWPALAGCHGCGKPRRVDLEQCPACHAKAGVPARNGTEIFVG